MTDLLIIVADIKQEKTFETLLKDRFASLKIREITFDIITHDRRDPGVYHGAAGLLFDFKNVYGQAIVALDSRWPGAPGNHDHQKRELSKAILQKGWDRNNFEVIVIDPELESWIWSTSNHIPSILKTSWQEIKTFAYEKNYWLEGQNKPNEPKKLFEEIAFKHRIKKSSSTFQEIAGRVSIESCTDPSFVLFKTTLQKWFGNN